MQRVLLPLFSIILFLSPYAKAKLICAIEKNDKVSYFILGINENGDHEELSNNSINIAATVEQMNYLIQKGICAETRPAPACRVTKINKVNFAILRGTDIFSSGEDREINDALLDQLQFLKDHKICQ